MNTFPMTVVTRRPRRSRRRKQSGSSAPPITGNRILSVVPGPAGNQMTLTLNGEFVGVDEWPMAFEVLEGENSYWATFGDNSNPPLLVLEFEYDVSTTTGWNVPNPEVWHFADEQPLEPPTSGSIG